MQLIDYAKGLNYTIKKKQSVAYAEELYVTLQLSKSLPHGEYAIISDLLLPNDGPLRTSQIDHVIVSTHGIFCIETKSHKGWIVASRARRLFRQVLYHDRLISCQTRLSRIIVTYARSNRCWEIRLRLRL